MNNQRNMTTVPFTLAEVIAVIEVFEALHGEDEAHKKMKEWSAQKTFTRAAFLHVDDYIDGGKN